MPDRPQSSRSSKAKRPVYSVCDTCARANGGVWPEGHLATWGVDRCHACGQETAICGVNDWSWPAGLPRGWIDSGWD
jgi:hypothetical protein